jgi:hypothetical protein
MTLFHPPFRLLQETRLLRASGVEMPGRDSLKNKIENATDPANIEEKNKTEAADRKSPEKKEADPFQKILEKRRNAITRADKDGDDLQKTAEANARKVLTVDEKLQREQKDKEASNKAKDEVLNIAKDGLTMGLAPDVRTETTKGNTGAAAVAGVEQTAAGQAKLGKSEAETKQNAAKATVGEKNDKPATA